MEDHPINLVTSAPLLGEPIGESLNSISDPISLIRKELERNSNNLPERPLASTRNEYRDFPKFYCVRAVEDQTEIRNDNILDCNLSFMTSKNICVLGLQVPSQILNRVYFNFNSSIHYKKCQL